MIFTPLLNDEVVDLMNSAKERSTFGVVHVHVLRREDKGNSGDAPDMQVFLNELVSSLKFFTPEGPWQALDASTGRQVMTQILHRGLSYNAERMVLSDAESIVSRILRLCGEPSQKFTNAFWEGETVLKLGGWSPITAATFDAGVITVGDPLVGMVWVEDED